MNNSMKDGMAPEPDADEMMETSENCIYLDEGAFPDAEDGQEVEATIKATVSTDSDGSRKLEVTSVDGNPVVGEQKAVNDAEAKMDSAFDNLAKSRKLEIG